MSENNDALLRQIVDHIEKGKTLSAETKAVLEHIQRDTGTDFSYAIEYLNRANTDFSYSRKYLREYQQEAIRKVEDEYRRQSRNKPNWFNYLWYKLLGY